MTAADELPTEEEALAYIGDLDGDSVAAFVRCLVIEARGYRSRYRRLLCVFCCIVVPPVILQIITFLKIGGVI